MNQTRRVLEAPFPYFVGFGVGVADCQHPYLLSTPAGADKLPIPNYGPTVDIPFEGGNLPPTPEPQGPPAPKPPAPHPAPAPPVSPPSPPAPGKAPPLPLPELPKGEAAPPAQAPPGSSTAAMVLGTLAVAGIAGVIAYTALMGSSSVSKEARRRASPAHRRDDRQRRPS